MPDPIRFLLAALIAWGGAWMRIGLARRRYETTSSSVNGLWHHELIGDLLLLGGLAGAGWLAGLPVPWPPRSALDRWIALLVPLVVMLENCGLSRLSSSHSPRIASGLRMALGPVLLFYASVYATQLETPAQIAQWLMLWSGTGILLGLLDITARWSIGHGHRGWVLSSLSAASGLLGLSTLLHGYIAGGLAGMLVSCAIGGLACGWASRRRVAPSATLMSVAITSVWSQAVIGYFFGRLPILDASLGLFAPCGLLWIENLTAPRWRCWGRWIGWSVVSILLLVVGLRTLDHVQRVLRLGM